MSETESTMSGQSTTSDEDLVRKNGTTTIAWKWFDYRRSDLQETTIFWKIGRKAVHAKGRNTTNLFSYLKQKHTAEFGESHEGK